MRNLSIQIAFKCAIFLTLATVFTSATVRAADPNQVPLVFIHGIKGATLVAPDGTVRWISGGHALGLDTPDLRLPLSWDLKTGQARDDSVAVPLESISLLFGLIQHKIYEPWLRAARSQGRPFFAFSYDWRRDNLETLDTFQAYIEKIRSDHSGARVRVVAHSMGGLITFALLNRHPEYFDSVVFAGVPFAGGIGFLPDLHSGEPAGLNHRILAPQVLFTFPSVYSLFSLKGDGLAEKDGTRLKMDFFSSNDWKRQALGIYAHEPQRSAPPPDLSQDAFLSLALNRAKAFRELLVAQQVQYPPILVVTGTGRPTLKTAIRNGPKSKLGWDFESAPKEDGDARVTANDSLPPMGVPYRAFQTASEHADLLNDSAVISEILAASK